MAAARTFAGLSRTEMASELGLHPNQITNYERGHTNPRRVVLLAYAMKCGVPVETFEAGSPKGLEEPGYPDYGNGPRDLPTVR